MAPQRRPTTIVDGIVDVGLALSVLLPSVAILLQVFYRYVLNDPTAWLDEFAVLMFAWMTMIGAAVAQRSDSHMTIDILVRQLPPRLQIAAWMFRVAMIVTAAAVLFGYGLILTIRMSFIEYPAMEISRGFLFATLPACMPLLLYYLVRNVLAELPTIRSCGRPLMSYGQAEGREPGQSA